MLQVRMLLSVNVTSEDVTYCKCYNKRGCYLVLMLQAGMLQQAGMLLSVNVTSRDVTYC